MPLSKPLCHMQINLAPAEALERIAGLLDWDGGSVTVVERGDSNDVARHPNFRLLAAMNPATGALFPDAPTLRLKRSWVPREA